MAHGDCPTDYLELYDGPLDTDASLGKFCGSRATQLAISSSNQLTIRFFSDGSETDVGFKLELKLGMLGL